MLTSLTVTLPHGDVTTTINPTGGTVIEQPSGYGKSAIAAGIVRAFTGEPGPSVSATTASGSTLAVTPRARTVTRMVDGDPVTHRATSAAEYRAGLPRAFRSPELTTLILDSRQWEALYAGGIDGNRKLRDALAVALPEASLDATVERLMGEDYRSSDSLDLKVALKAQTAANTRRDEARGSADAVARRIADARAQVERAEAASDATDARVVLAAEAAWAAYDISAARWTAHDGALSRWEDATPLVVPEPDAAAHEAARKLVDVLREEEASSRAKAAAERARVEAEARAAAEAERVKREADARAKAAAEAARVEAERAKADADRRVREAEARVAAAPVGVSAPLFATRQPEPVAPLAAAVAADAPATMTITCPACNHTWSPS